MIQSNLCLFLSSGKSIENRLANKPPCGGCTLLHVTSKVISFDQKNFHHDMKFKFDNFMSFVSNKLSLFFFLLFEIIEISCSNLFYSQTFILQTIPGYRRNIDCRSQFRAGLSAPKGRFENCGRRKNFPLLPNCERLSEWDPKIFVSLAKIRVGTRGFRRLIPRKGMGAAL